MTHYATLREANKARQKEWNPDDTITLAYTGTELAGEVAEACELVLNNLPAMVSVGAKRALAEELADVVICIDLVMIRLDWSRPLATQVSEDGGHETAALLMATHAGLACNQLKKMERHRLGMVGSRAEFEKLRAHLGHTLSCAYYLAKKYAINLDRAVSDKFNATSAKNGLITRYDPNLPTPEVPKAVLVHAYEWEGLYIDDLLVQQDHEIDMADLVHHLGGNPFTITRRACDEQWLMDRSDLPTNLSEVVFA